MGFLDKLQWRKSNSVPAGTAVQVPIGGALGLLLGVSGKITSQQAFYFYDNCQAVATVIDLIAETLSDLPIYISIEGKTVNDHEILDFLNSPHPDYTGRLFKTVLATHYLISGSAYVWGGGNFRYKPSCIAPLSPKNVSVIEGANGFAGSMQVSGMMYPGVYNRNKVSGRDVFLRNPVEQIKQIRRFSTRDNSQLTGDSKLSAVAIDVRQNLAGGKHNLKTLTSGGRLTLMFNIMEDMKPEKFAEAKQRILSQYAGPDAQSVGVVNAKQIDVKEMGTNNKDMDFAVLQRMTEKAVAKRYGVPMALVSDESSTFNNLSVAYQALYDNATIPTANQLYDGLGDMLFPRFGLDPKKTRFIVDDSSVPAIAMRKAEITLKRKQAQTWTDNELRAEDGLEPISDGDKVYRAMNMIAGGNVDEDKQSPRVMGDEEE